VVHGVVALLWRKVPWLRLREQRLLLLDHCFFFGEGFHYRPGKALRHPNCFFFWGGGGCLGDNLASRVGAEPAFGALRSRTRTRRRAKWGTRRPPPTTPRAYLCSVEGPSVPAGARSLRTFFLGRGFHYRAGSAARPPKKHGPGPRGLRAHTVSTHPQLVRPRLFLIFWEGHSLSAGQSTSPPKKRTWCLPGPCPHSHQGRGRPRSSCRAAAVVVAVAPVAITKAGLVSKPKFGSSRS
jgi:hypothetical protein